MRLIDYIEDNNTFFNNSYTYPEFITSTIKDNIEDIITYDYGMRQLRPYLEYLARPIPGTVTPELETVVQNAVLNHITKYAYKYSTLFGTEQFEYNPIENYNMVETMTDDTTETTYGKKDTITHEKDSSDTRTLDTADNRTLNTSDAETQNLLDTHTLVNLTTTKTDEIAGFNSSGFSDANRSTDVGTGSETNANTGTDTTLHTGTDDVTHTGTDTLVRSGTDTDESTLSGKDTNVRNYELTRSGNIGVTTSQQMIESERNVADFSALSELAHGIVNAITIGVWR